MYDFINRTMNTVVIVAILIAAFTWGDDAIDTINNADGATFGLYVFCGMFGLIFAIAPFFLWNRQA